MPGQGAPRTGRCWYCGHTTLRDDDPGEHIVPAAIGGTLTTDRICFACNQRASGEIDQPFLGEWAIVLVRREQMMLGRRGEKPPKLPQDATLDDGTRVEVDVWGGPWEARPFPNVERVGDEYVISAADEEELARAQANFERKLAQGGGGTLARGKMYRRELPPTVKVTLRWRPQVWLRMTAKMALGTASLVWDESWLDTQAAQDLIATLWDPDPRMNDGAPAGLVPVAPEGPLEHLAVVPEHLVFFMNYGEESKFIAILLGSEVVGLTLPRYGQSHPRVAWLMDGRGGAARELAFDELMMTAGQRAGLIPKGEDSPQP